MTAVIEPFYPKAGNGRRPYPLETMLRIHCMQHWYNLSDGTITDALYEIASMRLFARLSLDSSLPDRTTIMNFRHLLEQHQLARQLFKTINRLLAEAGVMMTRSTLVDATIIEAPSSTKNKEQRTKNKEQRATTRSGDASDQERQSVALWHEGPHWCRCQEWTAPTAWLLQRPMSITSISWVTCCTVRSNLSQPMQATMGAHQREDLAKADVDWLIARRPGKVKTLKQHPRKNKTSIRIRYIKDGIRAKVEHTFRIIKRQFGFVKTIYKRLLKNDNQLAMLFTLANLFRAN